MNDFYFISDDNITRDFIFQDGVHLSKDGTCILTGHFVDFVNAINNFLLNRNSETVAKQQNHKSSACKLQINSEFKALITQQTENQKARDDNLNALCELRQKNLKQIINW